MFGTKKSEKLENSNKNAKKLLAILAQQQKRAALKNC